MSLSIFLAHVGVEWGWEWWYSVEKLLQMSSPHRKSHPQQIAEEVSIIGAKFAENPPIIEKNWVILKEKGHFGGKISKKVPITDVGML